MRVEQLPRFGQYEMVLAALNPNTTHPDIGPQNLTIVQKAFNLADSQLFIPDGIPTPADAQEAYDGSPIIFFASGGDGTIEELIASGYGFVRNDPDATKDNQTKGNHLEIVRNSLLVADRAGNACNTAASALGEYALQFDRLLDAEDLDVAPHFPMLIEVVDKNGKQHTTDMAHSGVGVGFAAAVATELDIAKPELKKLSAGRRLAREALITARTAIQTDPIKLTLAWNNGEKEYYEHIRKSAGAELIATPVYAKLTKSPALEIGTTLRQPVAPRQPRFGVMRLGNAAIIGARLATGRHKRGAYTFTERSVFSITLDADNPDVVPYHVDGNLEAGGAPYILHPGDTMRVRLAQVPVDVLVRR